MRFVVELHAPWLQMVILLLGLRWMVDNQNIRIHREFPATPFAEPYGSLEEIGVALEHLVHRPG